MVNRVANIMHNVNLQPLLEEN